MSLRVWEAQEIPAINFNWEREDQGQMSFSISGYKQVLQFSQVGNKFVIIMSGIQELIFNDQQGQRPGSPLHYANNERLNKTQELLKCTLYLV